MQHMQRCIGRRMDGLLDGRRVFENVEMCDDVRVAPRS